jgi:two-component system sensor histidine kinase QseC
LEIGDEGPGVPPDQAEAMFQRFRKAQANSAGTGLGLAIVREVAESHAGTVAFIPGPTCLLRAEFPSQ